MAGPFFTEFLFGGRMRHRISQPIVDILQRIFFSGTFFLAVSRVFAGLKARASTIVLAFLPDGDLNFDLRGGLVFFIDCEKAGPSTSLPFAALRCASVGMTEV
jgi:hypothetical protein